MQLGSGPSEAGVSGDVVLQSGASGGEASGAVRVHGGASTAGTGGDVALSAGTGARVGGALDLRSGTSSASSGDVALGSAAAPTSGGLDVSTGALLRERLAHCPFQPVTLRRAKLARSTYELDAAAPTPQRAPTCKWEPVRR